MPATIDQNLTPNAVAEFYSAKDHGKNDSEAWTATVARLRYDVLRLAIATLVRNGYGAGEEIDEIRKQCIAELQDLQGAYEGEPDKPV